jgi:hypothetical protein
MSGSKFLDLRQSYEQLGKTIYGKKWNGHSIFLSRSRIPYEQGFPALFDSTGEPWEEACQDADEYYQPATSKQAQQYSDVQTLLLRSVWLSEVTSEAVDQSGADSPLPKAAWTEGQTRFQWRLPESEVHDLKEGRVWIVSLNRADVESFAKRVKAERAKEDRQEWERSGKGGRPEMYDWITIEPEILRQRERLGANAPKTKLAEAVVDTLSASREQRKVPNANTVRNKIGEMEKAGKLST